MIKLEKIVDSIVSFIFISLIVLVAAGLLLCSIVLFISAFQGMVA